VGDWVLQGYVGENYENKQKDNGAGTHVFTEGDFSITRS
jgi:hypothetical protein